MIIVEHSKCFFLCVCVENTGLVVNNKAPKATGLVLLHINKYKMHLILIELNREKTVHWLPP